MKLVCENCGEPEAYANLHNYTVDIGVSDMFGDLVVTINDEETNRECARRQPATDADFQRILEQETWHCRDCGEEDCVRKEMP